jgi:hypothetical protein
MTNEKKCCDCVNGFRMDGHYDADMGAPDEVACNCKCHSPAPQGREEKPRCTKCNGPFLPHHRVYVVQDREGFFHTSCAEKVLASRGAPISGLTKDDGPSSVLVAKELEAFPEAPQTEKWKSSLIHVGDATFQLSFKEGELCYEMRNGGITIQGEFSGLKEMLLASQRKEDAERIAGLIAKWHAKGRTDTDYVNGINDALRIVLEPKKEV